MSNCSEDAADDDEVTFLLRLRPTPSPPLRRRRFSLDYKPETKGQAAASSSKAWDVVLEQRKKPPVSPTQGRRRLSWDVPPNSPEEAKKNSPRKFPNFGIRRKKEEPPPQSSNNWEIIIERKESSTPPPLPPRIQPSAPPQEILESAHWYPKPYFTQQQTSNFCNVEYFNNLNFVTDPGAQNLNLVNHCSVPGGNCDDASSTVVGYKFVPSATNPLKSVIDLRDDTERLSFHRPPSPQPPLKPPIPSPRTTSRKLQELPRAQSELTLNLLPQEQDERYRKLQGERDNLQLQVQVLTEQIEAQTEKIVDLEKSLGEKKQLLMNTEDMLQREMLSRSSLETQKLELMSALSELKLQHAELERELIHLRSSQYNNNSGTDGTNKKNHLLPRMSPQPHHTSTPVHHSSNQNLNVRMSPSSSPLSGSLTASPRRTESTPLQHEMQPPKTPPATYKRQIDLQYASLPRQQFLSNGGSLAVVDSNANPADGARKGVAFAETEKIVIEDGADPSQSPSLQFNKNKGIKKIFGKLKRSGSGNLEDLPGIGEFQRGGVRATAAARLGWSEPQITPKPEKPFEQWTNDDICNWLQDLGLEQYTAEAKRWGKTGEDFLKASSEIAEKEFAIKNILHRKKLQLALIDAQENGSSDPYLSKAGRLDTAWVMRWLDDTGLPQHKEMFLVNRVDGRVLHRLTMDDLGLLHITSLLHVASIKRGIQVLRENNYEPGCLQRRSLPEDPTQPTPKQISLWTTHRVMEWLKAVDLAEYAPNLRGSGVHGGLMVLENKFTAELLASLLSIPLGKTLLRRHLNTHFKELLGKDVIQVKREAEATLGYIPLTPSSKLKVTKKSHFSLKRSRSKSEADYGDLVCPMNAGSQSGEQNGSTLNNSLGMKKMDEVKEEDASHLADENFVIDSSSPSSTSSPVPDRRTV